MSGWKVQKYLSDVVYDLRSRNLLPLAVLLLVGIIAAPIAISRSGSGEAALPPPVLPDAAEVAPENQAAALAYAPGVRNYKQRLDKLSSKNPFRQQFADPVKTASTDLGDALESISTGGGTDLPSSGGGGTGTGGGGTKKVSSKFTRYQYFYDTDVLVGEAGTTLARYNRIQPFRTLPSDQVPVFVFLGTINGDQAIFLVSSDVTGIGGQGTCFPNAENCQLLGLTQGGVAEALYGPDGKTYQLQVARIKLRIEKTTSDKQLKPPSP